MMKPALGPVLSVAVLAAVAVIAGEARAQDAAVDPVVPGAGGSPVYIWSGPYAGAFVGYNSAEFDGSGGADFSGEGWVGGLYAGINAQSGSFVYGIEGDIGGSDVGGEGFNAAAGLPTSQDTNVFGSLRGRVGVAVDPFMVFATGGVAVSQNEASLGGFTDSETSLGATVGAGIEAQISEGVTSRLEYRYSDFGSQTYDFGNTSVSSGFDEHSVRAGIALEF